jgi:hypothetical protein
LRKACSPAAASCIIVARVILCFAIRIVGKNARHEVPISSKERVFFHGYRPLGLGVKRLFCARVSARTATQWTRCHAFEHHLPPQSCSLSFMRGPWLRVAMHEQVLESECTSAGQVCEAL